MARATSQPRPVPRGSAVLVIAAALLAGGPQASLAAPSADDLAFFETTCG